MLDTPNVMGCKRLPEPPARTIPFIIYSLFRTLALKNKTPSRKNILNRFFNIEEPTKLLMVTDNLYYCSKIAFYLVLLNLIDPVNPLFSCYHFQRLQCLLCTTALSFQYPFLHQNVVGSPNAPQLSKCQLENASHHPL